MMTNEKSQYCQGTIPLDISKITLKDTSYISMLANRIDTEVGENDIYLRHYFRSNNSGDLHNLTLHDKSNIRPNRRTFQETFYGEESYNDSTMKNVTNFPR